MLVAIHKDSGNGAGWPAAVAFVLVVSFASCSKNLPASVNSSLYRRDIRAGIHDVTPVRGTRGPLRLHRDGQEEKCSACHNGFSGKQTEASRVDAHPDIVFSHGLNLLCLNCHHRSNSDVYIYHDGSEIPAEEPTRLCAKCHGPHFRDYTLGIHGRINGYWNAALGERKKLDCIQCHDPHRPRFQPLKPERPPNLVRFSLNPRGINADEH
ncbi:MAG: hypothetical protein HY706_14975 [Candidatus Hydrogenedentes bacterium]|nr:hypothetical protein [Candidatus Hydrogenedentota bacterium]